MQKVKIYMPSIAFLTIVAVLSTLFFALPKKDFSENEKRKLAATPAFSAKALADGSYTKEFETYLSDHFPGRNWFVGVNSYYELGTGRGSAADIYFGKDGYLIAAPTDFSAEHVTANVGRYAAFAQANGLKATLMIVPSTGYILDDKLPTVHKAYTDDAMFDAAVTAMGDDMAFVDLRAPFEAASTTTQLYYKTDHHVTSAGAYEMYKAYAAAAGLTPRSDYRIETADAFYGTGYSRSGYWLSDPDTIEMWHNDDLTVTVEIYENSPEPVTTADSVFFPARLEEADKYPVFLDGNHALTKIVNPQAAGGKLLIVKDSFAHCFTGFLAEHYREIYMVDMRYYRQSVSALVAENDIDEVLYLYGTENLSTESANSIFLQ